MAKKQKGKIKILREIKSKIKEVKEKKQEESELEEEIESSETQDFSRFIMGKQPSLSRQIPSETPAKTLDTIQSKPKEIKPLVPIEEEEAVRRFYAPRQQGENEKRTYSPSIRRRVSPAIKAEIPTAASVFSREQQFAVQRQTTGREEDKYKESIKEEKKEARRKYPWEA